MRNVLKVVGEGDNNATDVDEATAIEFAKKREKIDLMRPMTQML